MRASLFSLIVVFIIVSCQSEEERQQEALMKEFTEVGNRMAKISFESINGSLKAATAVGGIENAIQFCNLNAMSLTDSLSGSFEVSIKRSALKLRNVNNHPDTLEAYMLDLYLQIAKMKKPMVGKTILSSNNEVRYFAPIFLRAQCLQCHGKVGTEITDETYAIIKEHYPKDEAVGFREGELRGIWSINFGDINLLKKVPESQN